MRCQTVSNGLGWNSCRNVSILAAFVEEDPYVTHCAHARNCSRPGIDIELFDYICGMLGINYTLVPNPDELWGDYINGTWTGLMGMVVRGEVHMTAPTIERDRNMDKFTYTTISAYEEDRGWAMVTQNQDNLSFIAAAPFTWAVWIAVIIAFIVACTLMTFIEMTYVHRDSPYQVLSEQIWRIYGESLQQASNFNCKRGARSVLITFYRWYMLLVSSAYGASLITSLMVTHKFAPFTNIDELAQLIKYGTYTFLSESQSEVLQLSNNLKFKEAFQKNPPLMVDDEAEAMQRLINDPGLVYMGTIRYLQANMRQHCNVTVLNLHDPEFPPQRNVFVFYKSALGAQLRDEFNRQLSLMGEVIQTVSIGYVSREGCNIDDVGQGPITLNQIQSVVIVFVCGFPAAFMAVIIERVFDYRDRQRTWSIANRSVSPLRIVPSTVPICST